MGSSAKNKLPPMRPRVVVAEHLVDGGQRVRLLECLAMLDASRVLDDVRAYLEVERGALARQARTLPADVKKAAAVGERVFVALASVTAGAGMWSAMRDAKAVAVPALEAQLLDGVQLLLDLVYEAQRTFGSEARTLVAGLGGCDLTALRRFWATSGLEAGVNLAGEVRLAVLGVGDPFARFAPAVRARRLRKQQGREQPETPRDSDSDDLAILRAMAAGKRGKQVASATAEFGRACSESHVRKRRQDLAAWGWITKGRDAGLTAEGERWLQEAEALRTTAPTR